MTTSLMPNGRHKYCLNDGTSPAAGGWVYTYAAGTTTPKDAYTDSAGLVPHANPIQLDAKGEATIFWDGAYKIDVKTAAGASITGYPVDNFKSDPFGVVAFLASLASIGASLIGFLQARVDAVLRTVQDRLYDDIYLTDFMTTAQRADYRSGAAALDMSPAIQAMIDSATRSTNFHCPAGYARLGSTITFPGNLYLRFVGAGIGVTTFEFFGSGNAMESQSLVSNTQKTSFEEFTLVNHAGNTNATNGIYLRNGQYWSNIKNVWVDGFNKTGTQAYNGQNYYYAGIFAIDSWGAEWDRVMLRHNGVGWNAVQCQGLYKNMDVQANAQHGAFLEDCPATIIGGVFEGNSTTDYANAASTVQNAEIYIMGGEPKITGVFIEGEGINPPWSVVVDGRSATNRAFGAGIQSSQINRSRDTSRVRGCIKLNFDENTVIAGNSIQPTSAGAGAAAIPHINVTANTKQPQVGKNAWRGRQWYTGGFYADACPLLLPADLAALTVPYTFDSVGGGLLTTLRRMQHSWLFPGPLTAPQAETNGNVAGGTQTHTAWVERLSWLTSVILTDNAGLAAGNVTIRVYNRVNGAGALVLLQTLTTGAFSGTTKVMLSQHPFITRVDAGHLLVTAQTDAGFLPTVGSEITVQAFIEEDDTH